MAEKTELETESKQSPEQAADMLRHIADEIGSGEEITVEGNNASITVPGTVDEIGTELEVEHEIKGKYDQVEVEIELGWTIIPDEEDDEESQTVVSDRQ
jgi:amphi-Trp domain-containing protein